MCSSDLSGKDPKHKDSAEAIGSGTLMAVAPGKGILAHRNADGSLHIYVALNKSEEWVASANFRDARTGLSFITEQFHGWAPHLIALIAESEIEPVLRQSAREGLGVLNDCTCVLLESRLRSVVRSDRDARGDAVVRPALKAWEDRAIDGRCVGFLAEDHSAAWAAERLVGRRRHHVGDADGGGMHARRDEA